MSNVAEQDSVVGHDNLLVSYSTGFGLSVLLTITAYVLVLHHVLPKQALVLTIAVLALAQFAVQLLFFLHLGREMKPRYKLLVFLLMLLVVVIIVAGSLWIMNNLNYRMTPQQINTYMSNQDGL